MQKYLNGARTLRGDPTPAFATGGFHAGGLRLVVENGPELEATGQSRIWSAQQTAALFAVAIRTALLDNIDPNGVHRG